MICPHCLKTIEDGASFCPYCNAYVGPGDGPEHTEFVFCDGCGARLSPHDRTCPKCGRPAPGILSEDAAASDLAAGRTAGFPRLTQEQIDTEVPHAPASAAAVLSDAADPNETCVLPAFDKDFGIPKVDIPTPVSLRDDAQPKKQKPKRKVHPDEDAYHKHKRHIPKPLIVIAVLAAVCGGAYWFVTADPLGVMPGFYDQFGQAAQTTFPTRQKGEFATNPRNSHVDGALAMARSMDPDSAGSQFYFCLGAQHNLDSGYTVFGTTVEGLDVISQLRAGDEIVHVEIVHE